MTSEPSMDAMKTRLEQLESQQDLLREDMARERLEDWEGRLDDLGLQLHLGAMELRERLEPVLEEARDQIVEARARVDDGSSTASDALAVIRGGFEQVWADVRATLSDVRATVTD